MKFQQRSRVPVCGDCQPCSAAYSSDFGFYTAADSRAERWDNLDHALHSLRFDLKYENLCPGLFSEQIAFFTGSLCLNLPLRLHRADTRSEDCVFLFVSWALGRKPGKGLCTRVLPSTVSACSRQMSLSLYIHRERRVSKSIPKQGDFIMVYLSNFKLKSYTDECTGLVNENVVGFFCCCWRWCRFFIYL